MYTPSDSTLQHLANEIGITKEEIKDLRQQAREALEAGDIDTALALEQDAHRLEDLNAKLTATYYKTMRGK